MKNATLGYVGDVPVQSYLDLADANLPAGSSRTCHAAFRRLRLVKSAEEIEWLKKGAALTDDALEGLIDNVKPGLREYELGAIVETAALNAGGLPHLCYLSSGPQDGAGACVPRQNLSDRVDRSAATSSTPRSASATGAIRDRCTGRSSCGARTQRSLPQTVGHRARSVHALRQGAAAGATSDDVLDAADVIAERGFTINDGFLHGFGIGLLPP